MKNRDLWDIVWLHQHGIKPNFNLIPSKLQERKITEEYFLKSFEQRCRLLLEDKRLSIEFNKEMHRFLPSEQINSTIEQSNLWSFIVYLMGDLEVQIRHSLA